MFECSAPAIARLRDIPGLDAAPPGGGSGRLALVGLGPRRRRRCLVELVLARPCPLLGQSVASTEWLRVYNAAILARRPASVVDPGLFRAASSSRHAQVFGLEGGGELGGREEDGTVGSESGLGDDEVVREGDVLVLETYPSFMTLWSEADHFALVRRLEASTPPRHALPKDKARRLAAGVVFACAVVAVALQEVSLLMGMMIASFVLVAIQCCTLEEAFAAIKGRVVLTAVAAFGLGSALTNTGVTAKVAIGMVSLGEPFGPCVLMFMVYSCTACLSCLVSNQATVVIMYSIVKHISVSGLSQQQLATVLIIGASSPFMTPFGTPTNLMVYEPSGYSFLDYVKLGLPLTFLTGVSTAGLCHVIFPCPSTPMPPANASAVLGSGP